MKCSIHVKLLSDAYFGSIKPIESGVFAETLTIPSVYTFAGALMTRLLELGITQEQIKEWIEQDCIKIYGVYMKYNNEYYVPITPYAIDKHFKLRLPNNKNNFKKIELYSSTSILHNNVIVPTFESLDKENLKKRYFINMNNIEEDINVKSDIIKSNIKDRIRTALKYDTKTPDERKLFSLSILSIGKDYSSISYCIDVELPDNHPLDKWIGHFGGENSIAEFSKYDNIPLIDKINKDVSSIYLAVSHIPIKTLNDVLLTSYGRVEYIIGKVTQLGGFDVYDNTMKKVYACIEPGSIFKVNSNDGFEVDEWYVRLLNSAIPL